MSSSCGTLSNRPSGRAGVPPVRRRSGRLTGAISSALDPRNPHARVPLPVPGALLERLFGAELLHRQFLAQHDRLDDLAGHRRPAHVRLADVRAPLALADYENLVKGDFAPGL